MTNPTVNATVNPTTTPDNAPVKKQIKIERKLKTLKSNFSFNKGVIKTDDVTLKNKTSDIKSGLDTSLVLASKIAPYILAKISSDYAGGRMNITPLSTLYFALAGKTKKENSIQASLRVWACYHVDGLTFIKDSATAFGFTKSVKPTERYLIDTFNFSSDFRAFEKPKNEQEKKPVVLVSAKRLDGITESLINGLNSFTEENQQAKADYKLGLLESVLSIAGTMDKGILIARLTGNDVQENLEFDKLEQENKAANAQIKSLKLKLSAANVAALPTAATRKEVANYAATQKSIADGKLADIELRYQAAIVEAAGIVEAAKREAAAMLGPKPTVST